MGLRLLIFTRFIAEYLARVSCVCVFVYVCGGGGWDVWVWVCVFSLLVSAGRLYATAYFGGKKSCYNFNEQVNTLYDAGLLLWLRMVLSRE